MPRTSVGLSAPSALGPQLDKSELKAALKRAERLASNAAAAVTAPLPFVMLLLIARETKFHSGLFAFFTCLACFLTALTVKRVARRALLLNELRARGLSAPRARATRETILERKPSYAVHPRMPVWLEALDDL